MHHTRLRTATHITVQPHTSLLHLEVDDGEGPWVVKDIELTNDLRKLSAASGEQAGNVQLAAASRKVEKK